MAIIHLEAGDQIVLGDGLRLIAVPEDDGNEDAKNDQGPVRRSQVKDIVEDGMLSVRGFLHGGGPVVTKDVPDVVTSFAWPGAVKS